MKKSLIALAALGLNLLLVLVLLLKRPWRFCFFSSSRSWHTSGVSHRSRFAGCRLAQATISATRRSTQAAIMRISARSMRG